MDIIGCQYQLIFSECPDSLLILLFVCKIGPKVNGIIIQYWSIISGGIPQVSYEPITGVDSFDVFGIQECSSVDWNLKDSNVWGESAHYTKGM